MSKPLLIRRPRFHRLPKAGEKATPIGKGGQADYPNGIAIGEVVEIIDGACGPIVCIEFPASAHPNATIRLKPFKVDLFWKKIRQV